MMAIIEHGYAIIGGKRYEYDDATGRWFPIVETSDFKDLDNESEPPFDSWSYRIAWLVAERRRLTKALKNARARNGEALAKLHKAEEQLGQIKYPMAPTTRADYERQITSLRKSSSDTLKELRDLKNAESREIAELKTKLSVAEMHAVILANRAHVVYDAYDSYFGSGNVQPTHLAKSVEQLKQVAVHADKDAEKGFTSFKVLNDFYNRVDTALFPLLENVRTMSIEMQSAVYDAWIKARVKLLERVDF